MLPRRPKPDSSDEQLIDRVLVIVYAEREEMCRRARIPAPHRGRDRSPRTIYSPGTIRNRHRRCDLRRVRPAYRPDGSVPAEDHHTASGRLRLLRALSRDLCRGRGATFSAKQSPRLVCRRRHSQYRREPVTVVAETVHATWRFTVRPRGHPFHRELHLSESLENAIRRHAESWFLIVDEGPGLSGSSFVSVALKLERLGIPSDRIVLFPSHDPHASRLDIGSRA